MSIKTGLFLLSAVVVVSLFALGAVGAQPAASSSLKVYGSTGLYIFGVTNINGTITGVPAVLNLTVTNGTGQVFLGSTPLTQTDTQAQAVLSTDVACNLLNLNCDNYNFYYYITSASPEVGGPSAGSAFTMAAMSILSGKPLNKNIAMTGTANPDGSVGIVGDVSQKSMAAANLGIKVFLYPSTNNVSSSSLQYDEEHGLVPIPVSNEYQAFQYFTGYNYTPTVNSSINSPLYNKLMNKTYQEFLTYQNSIYNSIPNLNSSSADIASLISTAQVLMTNETAAAASGNYYVAASEMVSSSSYLLEAKVLENMQNSSDNATFISNLVSAQNATISKTMNDISSNYITNSTTLMLKFIALDRLAEAQSYMNQSLSSLSSGSVLNAASLYALGAVKSNTSYFWTSILQRGNSNFSQSEYSNLSSYYLYKALSYSTYASLLGAQVPSQSTSMQTYLTHAQNWYNSGQYVPSIFSSIEAISVAQMLIEENSLINTSVLSQINNQTALSALRTINSAENVGATPFLGII